jgi:hypothetical protein
MKGKKMEISWPSFTGTATLIGSSLDGRATIYVDNLGPPALENGKSLLTDAPRVIAFNDNIFGTNSGFVNVILFALGGATDGTGGADHMACTYADGGNLEVDFAFGQPARVSALFEAELSECNMNGRLCGVSTGEALSRWCAAVVSHNALADFSTAPAWFNDGMKNWVDHTEMTDRSPYSTGCGMAFLSWLMHRGSTLSQIARAMVKLGTAGTLAQLYEVLRPKIAGPAWSMGDCWRRKGGSKVWRDFAAACRALPGGVTNDDPFDAFPAPTSHRLK